MRTTIAPTLSADPEALKSVEILRKCVHCGFCNSVCPTYRHYKDEIQGPRGRIYLIRGVLERDEINPIVEDSLSRCLTCRACETTCPSGVEYGELAEFARDQIYKQKERTTVLERVLLKVIPNPDLFRNLYRLGRVFRFLLPRYLRELLYRRLPDKSSIDSRDGEVVLMQGCVQRVLTPQTVSHLARLLEARDVKLRTIENEQCCGSLHLHLGHKDEAQRLMRSNIEHVSLGEKDKILSSASGCGVTLKEYGSLLDDDPDAVEFSNATMDIAEFLEQYSFEKRRDVSRVAFQSPCTLQHGQKITGVVEKILEQAGYELISVSDANQCCGSAGTYSIVHPDTSHELRRKKIAALTEHKPEMIATANVGCQLHLESAVDVPVVHWVELLK